MKKFVAPLLATMLSLAVPAAANAEGKSVAMSFGGSTIELWNDIIKVMRPAIEKEGYQLVTDDPQFRVEQQVQDWKAWIAQGDVVAIMGWPISADALVPVTKQAQEAGIPVIGYAAEWEGVSASMLTTPEQDGRDYAAHAVDWAKEHFADAPIKVAVFSDEQNDLTRLRVEGIVKQVEENLPNATVFKLSPGMTREEGYTAAKQQMTAHPDTSVWLSFSNENVKGAYKALTDSGIAKDNPDIYMSAMDVTNEDLDMIKIPNGIYRMAFAFRSQTLAEANTKLLLAAAKGEKLENIFVRPELVTPQNADNFYVGK